MTVEIIQGDCLEVLRTMEAESVHCVCTSPPFWNQRNYGIDGQIGLERSPHEFVAKMVEVFSEVRRVLRADGTCWINLGDSYCKAKNPGGRVGPNTCMHSPHKDANAIQLWRPNKSDAISWGLKPKDLIGIPWRVALSLQSDGWWLRGDHPWAKPNGMPESVQDRPTRSHEYVFMLTKSERYWYDPEPVRTAPKASSITRLAQDVENQQGSDRANGGSKTNGPMKAVKRKSDKQSGHSRQHAGFNDRWDQKEIDEQIDEGANLRSVWWIPPAQTRGDHFAVMPERVAQICVLAGCPDGGIVLDPFCGTGTTGAVAIRNGCSFVGIELNPKDVRTAKRRLRQRSLL